MSENPRHVVGIDLGTSNCAMAHTAEGRDEIVEVAIPQVEAPGQVASHKGLPSVIYIPHEGERREGATELPWDEQSPSPVVLGAWARERGAEVPERVVTSAKSWLCNTLAPRAEKILPWRSELPAHEKFSPVEASALYLEHLKKTYQHAHGLDELSQTKFVVTVPASFDEVARNLTHQAAEKAGLPDVTLLEEPIAAFYAWIAAREDWRKQIQPGDVVLVCDVGGGTTDFSLIAVHEKDGDLTLERISVGNHLLLGGDNMDLTLAYALQSELKNQGHVLDRWQLMSLVSQARAAKERILAEGGLDEVPVSVATKGSSLFASTISAKLTREQVETILVDGFFPHSALGEFPKSRRGVGIQEVGLSYESDPAITRHLARFLQRSWENAVSNDELKASLAARLAEGPEGYLAPTAILFNGGVFKSRILKQRVLDVLGSWTNRDVTLLEGEQLDLAVAKGAAYYGNMRAEGKGIRVKAGTSRSFYIGLESAMPAVPGFEPPVKGLCLVPQGTEEGSEIELKDQQFHLVVGEPGEFRFFSSATRAGDVIGTVVEDASEYLDESAHLSVTLPREEGQEGSIVPVCLDAVVTEVGTLKLFMKHVGSQQKWNLEFDVRQ